MATGYKLSYTATDINAKLGKIDSLASKSDLEGKSDVDHTHTIESIEGLQEAIGKLPTFDDVKRLIDEAVAKIPIYNGEVEDV